MGESLIVFQYFEGSSFLLHMLLNVEVDNFSNVLYWIYNYQSLAWFNSLFRMHSNILTIPEKKLVTQCLRMKNICIQSISYLWKLSLMKKMKDERNFNFCFNLLC